MALSAAFSARQLTSVSGRHWVGAPIATTQQAFGDVTVIRKQTLQFVSILGRRTISTQNITFFFSKFSAPAKLVFHKTSRQSTSQKLKLPYKDLELRQASSATMPSPSTASEMCMHTSGTLDPVWVHKEPYSNFPQFPPLDHDIETEICIIGAGIAGISTAYELIKRGKRVVMIEARDVLAGETGRTSGHLTNDLDDGYLEIAKKHGEQGAKIAAQSHAWARDHIGDIAKELGIDCEYRRLPAYDVSQYPVGDEKHDQELKELKEEAEYQAKLGIETRFDPNLTVKGWTGGVNQRGGLVAENQATFHPTKYLSGLLAWLKKQPNFQCYTRTRAISVSEKGISLLGLGEKSALIETEAGNTIKAEHAVEATCVPLQKLSVITQLSFYRSYCIAVRVPRNSIEDCLLYDDADAYKYTRLTACDAEHDYLVVGGCDHKVGQQSSPTTAPFAELETWTRERFPQATTVDYTWSGQIFEPTDFMAFIGKNQGCERIYIVTGDSGDGLTHGVLAGRLIADEIDGVENPWAALYSPKRLGSIVQSLPSMVANDLQVNLQYKRLFKSDITDIEDLKPGCGGVLNPTLSKPVAVYKDENGKVHKYSAFCPHLKGVVCWNEAEKSFDCPVHGSRFSKEGVCIIGPAKVGLSPADEAGKAHQEAAVSA
ncbi:FAD dependent oxidoreductase-domain-containing protein [Podospora appendiculata]|uniref:FAD dependent oxidoreductase-domain-containing protein n=1 Tax=Podospora appendiculata TaxID=314037 RepID=A0AAE0XDL4_9PEZI|nr:FAD dependent oxidoreductase-domain-containing protein [Podospora appendiculata]